MKSTRAWVAVGAVVAIGLGVGLALRPSQDPAPTPTAAASTGVIDPSLITGEPTAPATPPVLDPEEGADEDHEDSEHEHDEGVAIYDTYGADGVEANNTHAVDAATALTTEVLDETPEARAERLAPLFAAETDLTELVGPIRRVYSSGQAVTVPAALELIYVLDGTDPDAVTYRVQLSYEGAWAEYGSSTARQYYESASWDLTVTFVEGAPLVTAASWAT